jgi:hypothetical protein
MKGENSEADSGYMLVGRLGILGGATTAVACGLISTWNPNTSTAEWIGYQILFGLRGMGLQVVGFPSNIPIIHLGMRFTPGVSTFTNRGQSGCNLSTKRSHASPEPSGDRLPGIRAEPAGGYF